MQESQTNEIEAKLKRMIELQNQLQKENQCVNYIPPGTKVIRRLKGTPDKHIM